LSLDWLFKNRATTRPDHPDPVLRTRFFYTPPELLLAAVRSLPEAHENFKIASVTDMTVTALRKTDFFGFVDDITIKISAHPHGSVMDVASASKVGKGDLGQNKRNILELYQAVGVELMDVKPQEGCEGFLHCHYTPHKRDVVAKLMFDPASLVTLSPKFPPVAIKKQPDKLDVGTHLVIELAGVIDWVAEYTEWNPPKNFADRQVSGPFEYFTHKHVFEDVGDGTVIIDRVHYKNKLGDLGKIFAGPLLAGGQLQNMFAIRAMKLEEFLKD
jgi:hypothetical protein